MHVRPTATPRTVYPSTGHPSARSSPPLASSRVSASPSSNHENLARVDPALLPTLIHRRERLKESARAGRHMRGRWRGTALGRRLVV